MNNTDQPLVSILTPVYNGEKYLRECIESVLRQTYRNWEYIIVNNQSKDATLAIAEEYARRDPRIRIHTNQEFVSAVGNHNIAFQQMSDSSRFCKMVHADDWLFPECVEKMVQVAVANPTVGFVSSYALYGTQVFLDGLPYPSTVVPGREMCRAFFISGVRVFGCPTSSLIRSDIIRRAMPFFPEGDFCPDAEASYSVLLESDLGFVHQVLTFSRLHEDSITSKNSMMDADLPGYLKILLKYGHKVLTEEEFAKTKRNYMRDYYRRLARRALRLREMRYWKFHIKRLRDMGVSLNFARVAAAVPIEVVKLCFDPARVGRVMRSLTGVPKEIRDKK